MKLLTKIKDYQENETRSFRLLAAVLIASAVMLYLVIFCLNGITSDNISFLKFNKTAYSEETSQPEMAAIPEKSQSLLSFSDEFHASQNILRKNDITLIDEMTNRAQEALAANAEKKKAEAEQQKESQTTVATTTTQSMPSGPMGAAIVVPSGVCDIEKMSFSNGTISYPQDTDFADQHTIFIPSGAELNNCSISFSIDARNQTGRDDLKDYVIISSDKDSLTISTENAQVDLGILFDDFSYNPQQRLIVSMPDTPGIQDAEYIVMKSDNVASLYVTSSTSFQKRDYVDYAKENKAPCSVTLMDEKGQPELSQIQCDYIKARGNSTFWSTNKKSYQIKTANDTDMLKNGESAKKWLLISLCFDQTNIRNSFIYTIAQEMGLYGTPEWRFVDLYYDGEYRGLYLLCEKVEIDDTRLNIDALEDANEQANLNKKGKSDLDNETLYPSVNAVNKYGCAMQYSGNVKSPENISGGYLLEQDEFFFLEEKTWFQTTYGTVFTVSSPEAVSRKEMDYITSFIEEINECVKAGGTHPKTGKKLSSYIDMESFIKVLYLQEWTKNPDGYHTSTYFYKPMNEDKLYAGPIWDMDFTFGVSTTISSARDYTGWKTSEIPLMKELIELPEFKTEMKNVYTYDIKPVIDEALKEDGLYDNLIDVAYKAGLTNRAIWGVDTQEIRFIDAGSFDNAISYLGVWGKERYNWLDWAIVHGNDENTGTIENPEKYSLSHMQIFEPAWHKKS